MAIDFRLRREHDPADPEFRELSQDLQGNILSSHGRDYASYLFVKFVGPAEALRSVLRLVARAVVTTADDQRRQAIDYKKTNATRKDDPMPGELFGSLLLASTAYGKLGRAQDSPFDPLFVRGMEALSEEWADPPATRWCDGYGGRKVDALILLAHDSPDALEAAQATISGMFADSIRMVCKEEGQVLRNKDKQRTEPFGFVDGISGPVYLKVPPEKGEIPESRTVWVPTEPLESVLVRDPAVDDANAFGSYFVFRKLEQCVEGFRDATAALATALGHSQERAGALIVGRYKDGTPALNHTKPGAPVSEQNDFLFDAAGPDTCPFHAHIRKVNPRGDLKHPDERTHRITRRSIPYADAPPRDSKEKASGKVGLLFGCYQASIVNQFAKLFSGWASNRDFVFPGAGMDQLVGQGPSRDSPVVWPDKGGNRKEHALGSFITMKGGELFFAPSMQFFRTL